MAVHSLMRRLVLTLALLLAASGPATACFGPKLYLGMEPTPAAIALGEIAKLYIKEKTGVESIRVELAAGESPAALGNDRVDLAVAGGGLPPAELLWELPGLAGLAAGPHPRNELQFTTVIPALTKLQTLLRAADLRAVVAAMADGRPAAAAARALLQGRRWI
jgi:hypothetical protein